MNIIRSFKETGNYNTELYCFLNNLDNIELFNDKHDLRHPLSIYNLSFGKVINSCNEVLELLTKNDDAIKEKYIAFLNNVNSFVDDGYNILKCFYDSNLINKDIIFADKWLEKINPLEIQEYKRKIKPYIKDTRYILNKIKHEHGRISQVSIKTKFGCCKGYFLEKYHNGTLEPDEEIHKKYNGEYTAFSYRTDIMKNITAVYYISEKLARYLEKNIRKQQYINNKVESQEDEKIKSIINKLWSLSPILFINEYFKQFDIIDLDYQNEELIIKSPVPNYYKKRFLQYKECEIVLNSSGDGTSKSFGIPYFSDKSKKC